VVLALLVPALLFSTPLAAETSAAGKPTPTSTKQIAEKSGEPKQIRRLIIGLYDGAEEPRKIRTRIHLLATMPLNHLGLIVRLYDIRKPLPDDAVMSKARGVLTWFAGDAVKNSLTYLKWANRHLAAGRRFVILGDPGIRRTGRVTPLEKKLFRLMMARMGLRWGSRWNALTYDSKPVRVDSDIYGFERQLPPVLPEYPSVTAAGKGVRAHLILEDKRLQKRSDLVVTGPNGGYVAAGYAVVLSARNGLQQREWLLNPFLFFRRAFGTTDLPKPDTTTMSGRRMFYSHVDGDAWHNVTGMERYRNKPTISAAVHYDLIIKGFPDLPVTIGPVTGDLQSSWYGDKASRDLARKMFLEPNVEIGSHTHSHPFAWGFFRNYQPAAELPYLSRYPKRPGKSLKQSIWQPSAADEKSAAQSRQSDRPVYKLSRYYSRPRAYAVKRFTLRSEIVGSVDFLNRLAPPGKKVAVLQWSGDTFPFPAALKLTRKLKIRNINGGDPRMDGRYRSYGWVSGIGRQVGDDWQIYSSGANENIYTKSWTQNFSAYRQVIDTFRNTETPIRIKPINIYYHFYIMERSDSARSLILGLRYVRSRPVAPVTTSKFASIGDGFFSTRIVRLAKNRWRVEDRDGVETIRFDNATLRAVDFEKSSGILGQRHFQGSLYIALDSAVERPVIALMRNVNTDTAPDAKRPYLIESRWHISGLRIVGAAWQFDASGYGNGEFTWYVPRPGRYRIRHSVIGAKGKSAAQTELIVATADHRLRFSLKTNDARARRFKISFLEPSQ